MHYIITYSDIFSFGQQRLYILWLGYVWLDLDLLFSPKFVNVFLEKKINRMESYIIITVIYLLIIIMKKKKIGNTSD